MDNITLGILGGGQLGRMSAMAAARLGISCVIFTPEENSPASQVAMETIVADYGDEIALKRFSEKVDVISYEFENIPTETVAFLQKLKPVYPDEKLLEVSQDRVNEKSFLNSVGIDTAKWAPVRSVAEVKSAAEELDIDTFILKTARFGYDGKGQVFIRPDSDLNAAWDSLNSDHIILEEVVDFECEISVITARDSHGKMVTYGPMLNEHKNHILDTTIVPSKLSSDLEAKAIKMGETLAEAVNLRGILTLELFVTKDDRILANEIAPRTHNSGHWSIDACTVSQFEQHVRCVCGLPAAPIGRHSDCMMKNLIGDDINKVSEYLEKQSVCIHLYGKAEVREGRKMGHITVLK